MSSSLQNRKVSLKFVNFEDDPCMIFRSTTNTFSIHLTVRQSNVKEVIDLVHFKFPALANKDLIFRPNENGRILRPSDAATLVWSQLVIEKKKPGVDYGYTPPTGQKRKVTSSQGTPGSGGSTSGSTPGSPPKRKVPKKTCVGPRPNPNQTPRRVIPAVTNPLKPLSPQQGRPGSSASGHSDKSGQSNKGRIGSPAPKVSPVTSSGAGSIGSNGVKKLTCRKTSSMPHKRFDIELEPDYVPPVRETKSTKSSSSAKSKNAKNVKNVTQQLLKHDSDSESDKNVSKSESVSGLPLTIQQRSGPPPLKQLKPVDITVDTSPVKYIENDPELRMSNWSYMKLTDLSTLPNKRDIVAFKLMQLEARSLTRSGNQDKVVKLSPFKEGVVTFVDSKYKMVTVELNLDHIFEIPDDSIAGPGKCKVITVDWTSVYFPKLVSREQLQ